MDGQPSQSWNIPPVATQSGPQSTFPPASNPSSMNVHNPKSPWDSNPPPSSVSSGWPIPSSVAQNPTGWGVAGPTANGWGVPPPSQQPWNPNGASPGGGGSFADAARKNVPNPPQAAPTVRPSRPYDTGTNNGWGSSAARVDQHTPWDCGSSTNENNRPSNWVADGTGHWGDPRTTQQQQQQTSGGPTGWGSQPTSVGGYGGGSIQQNDTPGGWVNNNRSSGEPSWVAGHPQQPPHSVGGWGNPQQQPAHQDMGSHRNNPTSNWDPNPQHPSMWVPPAPQGNQWGLPHRNKTTTGGGYGCNTSSNVSYDNREDMMWHDPNPKSKKVQPDKGTSCWGDPTCQGSINRWKTTSDDAPTDQPPMSVPSTRTASVWGDSPAGPQPTSTAPAAVTKSASIAAPGWGQESERPHGEWGSGANVGDWNAGPVAKTNSMQDSNSNAEEMGSVANKVLDWPTSTQNLLFSDAATGFLDQQTSDAMSGGIEARTSTEDNVFSSNPPTPLTPISVANKPTMNGPLVGKGQEMTLQDFVQAQGNGNANLRHLTQQIAEQLRVAVEKGLINIGILTQPLPQNVLLGLNQLLQRVPKLEQARKELHQLQSLGENASGAQFQEQQRLSAEISRLQVEIQQYQKDISSQTGNMAQPHATPDGSQTPSEGRSKLDQWKNGSSDNGKLGSSASTPNLEGVDSAFGNLKLDPWGVNKLLGAGGADWSPPSTTAVPVSCENGLTNGDSKSDIVSEIGKSPASRDGDTHGSSNATPTPKIEGPKEFIPGKKWEWKDPKEVAEDPNATPGSLKQYPLSVGSISFTGTSSMSHLSGMGTAFGTGAITPTKLAFDPRPSVSTISPNPNMYNADPIWGMRGGRPPMSQPFPVGPVNPGFSRGGPGYNRSISTPVNSAFAPYTPAGLPTWVVLGNLGQADEQALKSICTRIARVSTFACPPGGGFACVRFSPECSLERVVPRLQHEVAAMGVNVQVAKDSDVDRLLQAIGGGRASHSIMPPGHGIIWPDQSGAPWGAPPFAGGGPGPMLGPEMMGLPPPPHMQESFLPPHGDAAY